MNGSREDLDLVIVTDEPQAWDGDYWKRNHERDRAKMLAISFTEAEKKLVEEKYGVTDYMRPLGGEEGRFTAVLPHRPHLGVVDIATVAHAAGYSVATVDNVYRYPERMRRLEALLARKPAAVGLSTTFILTPKLVDRYVTKIRELAPETKIILGGATIRWCREAHPWGDYVVFGDGEEAIVPILDHIHGRGAEQRIPFTAIKRPDGSTYYSQSAEVSINYLKDGKPYKARDTKIPIAEWTLLDRSLSNVFSMEFSRGCKYACAYCSYDRVKHCRDLDDARDELIKNAELGITRYRISDANFSDGPHSRPDFCFEVCEMLAGLGLDLKWSCYARADNITHELAAAMKKAGCFGVCFGVESGDDDVLRNMVKRHDSQDAVRAIQICREHGILTHANFIVGYPGETRQTFENTLEFVEASKPDTVGMGQFRVTTNVPLWSRREQFGLEGDGMVWRHNTMTSDEADELLVYGMSRLINQGVCMGHEFGFPLYMGLGLDVDGALAFMQNMHRMIKEPQFRAPGEFEAAQAFLRDTFINVFAPTIAAEQRHWRARLETN